MKTTPLKFITANLTLAAALTLFAGCASKSFDKGAATATALQSSADAVAQTSTGVTGVLGALNNLAFKSQGDLRNQYDTFVGATKSLNQSLATLEGNVTALHAKADAYFNDWTNQTSQIQSADLRQRSLERKDEVFGKLNQVSASYQALKTSLKPFTTDLADIQTYLGTDLTATGLATIKDVVTKTKVDAVPLRDAIKQLQVSFSSLSASLSPVLPPAAK